MATTARLWSRLEAAQATEWQALAEQHARDKAQVEAQAAAAAGEGGDEAADGGGGGGDAGGAVSKKKGGGGSKRKNAPPPPEVRCASCRARSRAALTSACACCRRLWSSCRRASSARSARWA